MLARRIKTCWSKGIDSFWSGGIGTVWYRLAKTKNHQYSQRFLEEYQFCHNYANYTNYTITFYAKLSQNPDDLLSG